MGASKLLLVLVVSAYVFSWSAEAWCWSCVAGPNSKPGRKIPIRVWKKGFKYQEWADKHFPFYVNDVLVFKYNKKNTSVYSIPDEGCSLRGGKKLVARGKGSSRGVKFLLRNTSPYNFASGDHYGCNHHKMQFIIVPWPQKVDSTTT